MYLFDYMLCSTTDHLGFDFFAQTQKKTKTQSKTQKRQATEKKPKRPEAFQLFNETCSRINT